MLDKSFIVDLVKTRPPRIVSGLIDRACSERLSKDESLKLNAVAIAPAGYGKTGLLLQHYEQVIERGSKAAWFTVSDTDRDPLHFIAGISAALQSVNPNFGNLSHSLLSSGLVVTYKVVLTALLNEILLSGFEISLFIDDLDRAGSKEFETVMTDLLESCPPNLRLVMASRLLLPVFKRMRARSQLRVISLEDLLVDLKEAGQLLELVCDRTLISTEIIALLEKTDGWINGIHLAALSINAGAEPLECVEKLSGDGRDFVDYIEHGIYDKLSSEIQDFLVQTSILEVLTPDLCVVVTGADNAGKLLDQIIKSNLFLTTLDSKNSCYRYHHFFKEFLQSKLTEGSLEGQAEIHRRAYSWCTDHGLFSEAIDHMISAGDWEVAANAIEKQLQEMLSTNKLSSLKQWVICLPPNIIESNPMMLLALGWVEILRRQVGDARMHLEMAESLIVGLGEQYSIIDDSQNILRSNVVALRAVADVVEDHGINISRLAELVNVGIPQAHHFFLDAFTTAQVHALMYEGRFDRGHRLAIDQELANKDTENREPNIRALVYSHIFRGIGYRLAGDLEHAQEQYMLAEGIANKKFGEAWSSFSVSGALLAEVYYEWGDAERALQYTKGADVLRFESSVIEPLVCLYQVSARISANQGERERALQILAEAEAIGRQDNYNRLVVSALSERIRLLVAADKMDAAAVAYEDIVEAGKDYASDDGWSEVSYYVALGVCRYLLATNNASEALPLIVKQSALARKKNQTRHRLKILLLEAAILLQLGKTLSAANRIEEAISIGSLGKFKQSFLDADPSVRALIGSTLQKWNYGKSERADIDQDYVESLRSAFGVGGEEKSEQLDEQDFEVVEPLTRREVALLKLLGRGLKNKELADELNVSTHTVAWHLKNLYAKLGVDNRTAAVSASRRLLSE